MEVIDDILADSEVDLGTDIGEDKFSSILNDNLEAESKRIAVQRGGKYIVSMYLVRSLDYTANFQLLIERRNGDHTYHLVQTQDPVRTFYELDSAFKQERTKEPETDLFAYRHPSVQKREAA